MSACRSLHDDLKERLFARFFEQLTREARTPVTPITENGRRGAAEDAGQLLDRTLFRSRHGGANDSSP